MSKQHHRKPNLQKSKKQQFTFPTPANVLASLVTLGQMPVFYAHSHPDYPDDPSKWEPLFSEDCGTLHDEPCPACEQLSPQHGHLNKVAYLAGKFASEMFLEGSREAELAEQWGRLAGWWHDLGKFAPEWQAYLKQT